MSTTELYFSVTGEAVSSNGAEGAFTLTFDTPTDGRFQPDFFQDSIVPLNNYTLTVNGTLYSAPSGEFWGGFEMPGDPYFVNIWGNQFYQLDNFVLQEIPQIQLAGISTSVPAPCDFLAVMLWCVVAAGALAFSTRDNV